MTALPKTRQGLESAGYVFDGPAKCKGCGAAILWFMTPKARRMPFEIVDGVPNYLPAELKPHWASCPQAQAFRNPRLGKKPVKKRT